MTLLKEILQIDENWEKLNKIARDKYGEFGFNTLKTDERAKLIDMKAADKYAEKEYGEFGFDTLKTNERKKLINDHPELIK